VVSWDRVFAVHRSIPCVVFGLPSFLLVVCHVIDSYLLVTSFFLGSGVLWPDIQGLFRNLQRMACACCFLNIHCCRRTQPLVGAPSNRPADS